MSALAFGAECLYASLVRVRKSAAFSLDSSSDMGGGNSLALASCAKAIVGVPTWCSTSSLSRKGVICFINNS